MARHVVVKGVAPESPLSRWARAELDAGSWVRRMFAEGQRLRALHGDDAVHDLALGQPLGEPPQAVREALQRAAAERGTQRFAYMPNLGYAEVRERAAQDVAFPGVTRDAVAMTGGAGAALSLALRSFVDPGDEVIGFTPYFGEYRAYCSAAGARFVAVPSRPDMSLDLAATEAALSRRTAAVILNTPNNPSGHVTTEEELRGLAELLQAHRRRSGRQVVLVVDAVYRRLVYPPAHDANPMEHYDGTVLARSFSKDLGLAGERIGYLALHPALADLDARRALEVAQRALGFVNAPATMQRMLLHLDPWDVDLAPFRERRDHAVACARDAGLDLDAPQGGLYLWIRSPWGDGLAFTQALAEKLVIVAPGIAFGMPDRFRVCFTAPRDALETAMARIAEVGAVELTA
jgi:aspartate aminotransferase